MPCAVCAGASPAPGRGPMSSSPPPPRSPPCCWAAPSPRCGVCRWWSRCATPGRIWSPTWALRARSRPTPRRPCTAAPCAVRSPGAWRSPRARCISRSPTGRAGPAPWSPPPAASPRCCASGAWRSCTWCATAPTSRWCRASATICPAIIPSCAACTWATWAAPRAWRRWCVPRLRCAARAWTCRCGWWATGSRRRSSRRSPSSWTPRSR